MTDEQATARTCTCEVNDSHSPQVMQGPAGTVVDRVSVLCRGSDQQYEVVIGHDLLEAVHARVCDMPGVATIVIIVDEVVEQLYGPQITAAFAGKHRLLLRVVPAGEQSKTRELKAELEDWMLSTRCDARRSEGCATLTLHLPRLPCIFLQVLARHLRGGARWWCGW